jgi:hypothetical protein
MTRFTLSRSEIRAEVERRKAGVTPPHAGLPVPAASASPPKRWSAKVFVVPAAVAEALARFASRTIHGIIDEPQVGEKHSMRRHRGVYIWRPAMDQQPEPGMGDELIGVRDVRTAETEIRKIRQQPH